MACAVSLQETFDNAASSNKGQFLMKAQWTDDNGKELLDYEISVCIV